MEADAVFGKMMTMMQCPGNSMTSHKGACYSEHLLHGRVRCRCTMTGLDFSVSMETHANFFTYKIAPIGESCTRLNAVLYIVFY